MTLDPAELRATAEAVHERKREEREREDRKRRNEYNAQKKAAMDRVPIIIRDLESAIQYKARQGATHYSSTQNTGEWSGQRYDDLVRAPLEAVVAHFRSLGFGAKIEQEHTTEYYSDGAGPGPTLTKIVIDWKGSE